MATHWKIFVSILIVIGSIIAIEVLVFSPTLEDFEWSVIMIEIAIATTISLIIVIYSDKQQERTSKLVQKISEIQNNQWEFRTGRRNWAFRGIELELDEIKKEINQNKNSVPSNPLVFDRIKKIHQVLDQFGDVLDAHIHIDITNVCKKIEDDFNKALTAGKPLDSEAIIHTIEKLFDNIRKARDGDTIYSNALYLSQAERVDADHKLKLREIGDLVSSKPEKTIELLEKLENEKPNPDVVAWLHAIKSNVYRRLKKMKEANASITTATKTIKRNERKKLFGRKITSYTKHLVDHYKSLVILSEVSSIISDPKFKDDKLKKKFKKTKDSLAKNIDYFRNKGEIPNSESAKNTLALLLYQNGLYLKKLDEQDEAQNEFANSIRMFESIIHINKKLGNFKVVGQAYRNLALNYSQRNENQKVIEMLISAEQFYNYVLPVPHSDIEETHYSFAEVYEKMETFDNAINYAQKFVEAKQKAEDWHKEARGLIILGECLYKKEDFSGSEIPIGSILDIYDLKLKTTEGKKEFFDTPYAKINALESLQKIINMEQINENFSMKAKELSEKINNTSKNRS